MTDHDDAENKIVHQQPGLLCWHALFGDKKSVMVERVASGNKLICGKFMMCMAVARGAPPPAARSPPAGPLIELSLS
eukprot:scaffold50117_cov46-Cyclotella_meneghiniana.AAC.2